MISGLFVILVIINALEDGFRDSNKKVLAHLFNGLHIAGWIAMMYFDFSWVFVLKYVLIRFALFDVTYNLIRGNKIFYIGTTSLYDKFWRWLEHKKIPINHLLFWTKLISLLIAL
jgi:hypothetical protein